MEDRLWMLRVVDTVAIGAALVVALAVAAVDTEGVMVDVRTDSVIAAAAMASLEAGLLAAEVALVAHAVVSVVGAGEASAIRARVGTAEEIERAAEEGLHGMRWMTSACKSGKSWVARAVKPCVA